MPCILKYKLHGAEVRVVGHGLKRFAELKGKRTILCPNHSYRHDPEVMFTLSCLAGEEFNFIAAREVFDWNRGFNGWLLQNLGCYSVVRGAADRESFKCTKSLLVAGKKKLVLFPEGEISKQNDVLLPLEGGAVQMAYWAVDELQKHQQTEPIYIMPVAIKYTYKQNIHEHLSWCMDKLEHRLGMSNHSTESLYMRVRSAANVILAALERQYNVHAAGEASLNDRIHAVKTHALQSMAGLLDIELPAKGSHLDWVRVLRNTMDDFIYQDEEVMSAYERKIHAQKEDKIKTFYHDLDRVVGFIAIYEGYLSPPTTQERLANVIELMEQEVFGEVSVKGPRLILLDLGQPINLLDHYAEFKKNKRAVIDSITDGMTRQISGMLNQMDQERQPVYIS